MPAVHSTAANEVFVLDPNDPTSLPYALTQKLLSDCFTLPNAIASPNSSGENPKWLPVRPSPRPHSVNVPAELIN